MRLPLVCFLVLLSLGVARAAEPFFKKNDVIALVGGEDMVVAGEDGYLETLIMRALPDYHLRFRSLAWEGDTVFEQNRDLNFPTWEEALDKIGATVVICQFGQMESLAGKEKIPEFIAAYEKLLERFSAGGKRRVVVLSPTEFDDSYTSLNRKSAAEQGFTSRMVYHPDPIVMAGRNAVLNVYTDAMQKLAESKGYRFQSSFIGAVDASIQRDGVHLNDFWQRQLASILAGALDGEIQNSDSASFSQLLTLIVAKNRLWYDYWRVQNWAFLAGDRTNQPSSRDWKDPSKRWFPAEREEFLPLIATKEKEIDALAAKLK